MALSPDEKLARAERELRELDNAERCDPAELAGAFLEYGYALHEVGRSDEALATCDEVIDRFGEASAAEIREKVAWALRDKAEVFFALEDDPAAFSSLAEIETRFSEDTDPRLVVEVLSARVRRAGALLDAAQFRDALGLYDEICRDRLDLDLEVVQVPAAQALGNRAWALAQLERWAEALATYDELLEEFFYSTDPEVREQVAVALDGKADALVATEQHEAALETIRELQTSFAEESEALSTRSLSHSLLTATGILIHLGRYAEASSALDEYFDRYWRGARPVRRASALELKARIALHTGSPDRAVALYERVLASTEEDDADARPIRAYAEYHRALALEELSRPAEACAGYAAVVRTYDADPRADVRGLVELARSELARLQGARGGTDPR